MSSRTYSTRRFVTTLILATSVLVAPSALAWEIETVVSGRSVGSYVDIAVDHDCRPHISYHEFSNTTLRYATKRTAMWWDIKVVDDEGWEPSIALDDQGNPHISYLVHGFAGGDLKYAHLTGAGWDRFRVDTSPGVGINSSIAIDDRGSPHIAYHAGSGINLKYAFFKKGRWFVETVDSVGPVGMHCALALEAGTTPYISYRDANGHDLKLAWRTGNRWHFELVDTVGEVGLFTSIAIGPDGYPQIAHHGSDQKGIRVARWTGSDWRIQKIDPSIDVGRTKCAAVDTFGNLHITYRDAFLGTLKHAYWTGWSWRMETVDDEGYDTGYYNSIAVDSENNVHIAYCSYKDTLHLYSDLKYATKYPTRISEKGPTNTSFGYRLFQNSPNPFSSWTTIRFQLAQRGMVSIDVHDIAGRRVEVLTSEKSNAGLHQVRWDGTDGQGSRLPGGVYFYRLNAGNFTDTKKMLLLR